MQPHSKILIVDDNPMNVFGLEELLKDDYHLATAATGEEALQQATDFLPDLVLLDVMMPGIDGYETCRQLRTLPYLQHTKILMVSAKAMTEERLQGYEAGADDYITKPFNDEELQAKLRVYLQLKSAEEVNQLKSDVIALLQHETRTPLNGIITPAKLVRDEPEMEIDERQLYLDMILDSANHLHELLDQIITLSALKAKRYDWDFEVADVGAITQQVVAGLSSTTDTPQPQIVQEGLESILAVVDIRHINTVIQTLLDNAIRFSPKAGDITIRLWQADDRLNLSVTDQGDGIPPAYLPRIFDEFAAVDMKHHTGGGGLSLAIARQIVLAHDGTIHAESLLGHGTTFTVSLPVAPT